MTAASLRPPPASPRGPLNRQTAAYRWQAPPRPVQQRRCGYGCVPTHTPPAQAPAPPGPAPAPAPGTPAVAPPGPAPAPAPGTPAVAPPGPTLAPGPLGAAGGGAVGVVLALVGVVVVMVVVVVDFGPLPLELQAPVSAVKAMAAAIPATTGKRWGMRFSVIEFVPFLCLGAFACEQCLGREIPPHSPSQSRSQHQVGGNTRTFIGGIDKKSGRHPPITATRSPGFIACGPLAFRGDNQAQPSRTVLPKCSLLGVPVAFGAAFLPVCVG